MTTYGDAAHDGDTRSYLQMTLGWWYGYLAMMVQSWLLYLIYRRRPAWLAAPGRIAIGYVGYIAVCWPGALQGLAVRRCFKFGFAPSLSNALHYCATMDKFEWFVVFVLWSLAFGAVLADLLWRQRRHHADELAQAKLSLERQRLAGLRGSSNRTSCSTS